MFKTRRTMNQLQREMGRDLRVFTDNFMTQLRIATPVDTGYARSRYQNVYQGKRLGGNGVIPLIKNDADYSAVLDGRSDRGFISDQAPQGIVEPAFKRTRKK